MTVAEIALTISREDREIILHSAKSIRRSRIDIIRDDVDTHDDSQDQTSDDTTYTRSSVDREWPKAGEVVIATNPWTGDVYTVLVVENTHRKNRVEFETQSGQRFHSPSPLCKYLFGKRVSNGWSCIKWF